MGLLGPLILLQLLSPVPAEASTGPEILPLWGGDVRSLAIHPQDPDLLAAGTSAGHVALSRDGGRSWTNPGVRVPFEGWVVGTLRFDPHHPRRLWAGLWGVWGSGMLAVSDDLGATWRERRGGGAHRLPPEPVYDLALVSGVPDLLYAGTLSGVWVSRDAGHVWSHLTAAYPEVHHVSSLLVDVDVDVGVGVDDEGAGSQTLLAGTWRRAYRSDDGGLTWRGVFAGMALDSEVFQLRPVPGRVGELWASTCGWVYRTSDLGERWTRFKEGLPERRTPSFAALEDGRLLAGTIAGLYVSGDRGRSWQRRTDPRLSIRAIAHDPRRPSRIVLATEGAGVWISTDGGTSFEPSSRGLANVRIAALKVVESGQATTGREVLAAIQHAGPLSGAYRSTDGGRTFEPAPGEPPSVLDEPEGGHGAPSDRPFDGGRWEPTRHGELYWGRGEVWHRSSPEHLWRRIVADDVLRVLTTGDPRLPHLVIGEAGARPFEPETGELGEPLPLFFPARDVSAAAIDGDRLLLGTLGHGLIGLALPALTAGPPLSLGAAR